MSRFDFGFNEQENPQLELELDGQERYTPYSEQMVNETFRHFREKGFPYIVLTDREKKEEFNALKAFDTQLIFGEEVLSDSTGVALANSYHPHRYDVQVNDNRTAIYVFQRDHLLKKCIQKSLKMNGKATPAALRSMISIFEGVQVPSNFPPATAKEIYEYFLPNTGVVWDMSCGWGGRLLAAMSTDAVTLYQGTEPSTVTVSGLDTMRSDFKWDSKSYIVCTGSESPLPSGFVECDLCFTSPPYFNTEKYAREPTQSFIKYPTRTDWMHKFMRETLLNCNRILKESGFLVVNIANVSTYRNLCNDFLKEADLVGFRLLETKYLQLSTMPGGGKRNKNKEGVGNRNEPIFIFAKK